MQFSVGQHGTVEIVSDPTQFTPYSPHPHHHGGARGRGWGHGDRGRGGGGWRGGGGGGFQNSNRFVDFSKPWITAEIKTEVWRKKSLTEAAKRSKSAEAVAALQTQAELIERLVAEAKISWLAANPDLEAEWLPVMAQVGIYCNHTVVTAGLSLVHTVLILY